MLVMTKWLREGTAGFSGYEYTRADEPGWYWLTICCSLFFLAFYLASGIIYGFVLTTQKFEWSSTLNFVYLLLLLSQETGLLRHKAQSS